MHASRPAVSGLLVVLALITAPVCDAEQAPAHSVTSPAAQEALICGVEEGTTTSVTPPATQEHTAGELSGGYAAPIPTEELGQISGGALILITPEQLQKSAGGIKLWDEALMRPAGTVESGPGQIVTSVCVQQTLVH